MKTNSRLIKKLQVELSDYNGQLEDLRFLWEFAKDDKLPSPVEREELEGYRVAIGKVMSLIEDQTEHLQAKLDDINGRWGR